mmetsp:Transcript_34763/g.83127  ORF Transcript_34763/g.83127 Transcript_34763/m.83127 type:complete len:276 (-) Transcript_34763:19-846(-)
MSAIIMSDECEDADLQTALIKADELIKTLLQELDSKKEIIQSKNDIIATLEAKLVDQSVELASCKTEIDTLAEVSDFDSSLRLSSFSAGSDLKLDVDWGTLVESSDHSVDLSLEGEGVEGSNALELICQSNQTLSPNSPKHRPPLFRWSIGSSTRSIDDCPDKSSRSDAADDDMSSSDFNASNRCMAPSSGFLGIRFKSNTRQDVAMPPSSHERNKAQTRTTKNEKRRRPSRRPITEQSKSSRSFIAGVCFPETEEDAERQLDCCLGRDKPILWS